MFRAIGRTALFAASMAARAVSHVVRDTANYFTHRVIPQGAAEVSQALNHQSNAYVPYGHAQAPVRATAAAQNNALSKWSDRFPSQAQGRSQGMSQGM
jgi:hypothetical protein